MSELISTDIPFSSEERQLLAWLSDQMIPPEGDLPGGGDAAVQLDALPYLVKHAAIVSAALADLISRQIKAAGEDLDTFKADHPVFIQVFQQAVIASYYRQDAVLTSLGLPARAPFPEGNTVEPTDWSLLDPVRQKTPFFKEVD